MLSLSNQSDLPFEGSFYIFYLNFIIRLRRSKMLLNIIVWIIFGALAGWIASMDMTPKICT